MKPQYILNPVLKTIKPGYPGNELVAGKFVNEDHDFGAGFSKILQWMFTRNPQREEKKRDGFRLQCEPDLPIFRDGADAFSWLGHSCFVFRINNKRIITDPVLYDLPGIKRLVASPYHTKDIIVDYILLSHSHRDHFDRKTFHEIVRRNPVVKVFCPLNMQPLVSREGARFVTEAGWYQEFPEDETGIRFVFLPAKHWNRRYMHDTNRELWGAFWIGNEKQSVYFAGDTAYHTHFTEAKNNLPEINHVFMPVGAYKPAFMMRSSHINPEEAHRAFYDLAGKKFIPMHYGTYDLSDEPLSEPIELTRKNFSNTDHLIEALPGKIYPL